MIVEKTNLYLKYRNVESIPLPDYRQIQDFNINKIKRNFINLDKSIDDLKKLQNKDNLPSFSLKNEVKSEIKKMKYEIEMKLVSLESEIKNIRILQARNFFVKKFQNLLLKYKSNQQEYLKNMKNLPVFNETVINSNITEIEAFRSKQVDIEDVRKSIFFITTVLLEMKNLLIQQRDSIDRIDYNMEISNNNLNKASHEILRIKKNNGKYKNKIITFLISFIIVLLFISLAKVINKKNIMKEKILYEIQEKL